MTKKTTTILWGWLSCTLVTACSGGDKDTAGTVTASSSSSTSTTASMDSTNSATTSDSVTSTTSGTSGTATESSTTSTSTTGVDTCGPCTFVDCHCDPDPVECDLWNDDCPEGWKCMPWANDGGFSWNATKCVPLDPMPGKPGDPCMVEGGIVTGIDSCEKGAMCWNVDSETLMGYCVGFCDGSPESFSCAEPGTFCEITNDGVLILCLPG